MYLVLFSIVLYRTVITVYTDNIFLYNYLRQIHQIINLSLVGCFTPALGKTVQKNHEVSRVKRITLKKEHELYCTSLLARNFPFSEVTFFL